MMKQKLKKLLKSKKGKVAAMIVGAALFSFAAVILVTEIFGSSDTAGRPYYQLGADRVLLMNRDDNSICPIWFQGYSDTRKEGTNWWEFVETSTINLYKLKAATHARLHEMGANGKVIWEYIDCRHGNLSSVNNSYQTYQNYLPFSGSSKTMNSASLPPVAGVAWNPAAAKDITAGQIIFRNTPNAQVVSSCYDEGIGTIYFDAVNGFIDYKKGRLGVEVAYGVWKTNEFGRVVSRNIPDDLETNEVGVVVAPRNEVADEVYVDVDGVTLVTNAYGRCAWVAATITGKYWCKAEKEVAPGKQITLALPDDNGAGGTKDYFYRLWAPIQDAALNPELQPYCRGPMRFRIRRLDRPSDHIGYFDDADLDGLKVDARDNTLIVVDNIVASYPAMKIELKSRGEYATGLGYRGTVGWTDVLSSRCVAFGETGLKAEAGFTVSSNNPPAEIDYNVMSWLDKASFTYRWRYLNQATNDWEELELGFTDGKLVSAQDFPVPEKAGDVEFFYNAKLSAPYYGYVDYSGKGYNTPGYTERISNVETRLNPGALGKEANLPNPLPSLGTDFFFRLRDGKSEQLSFRLEAKRPDDDDIRYSTEFWLVGDGTWRCYYKVSTNELDRTWQFRIVGANPTNYWGGNAVTEMPWTGQRLFMAPNRDTGWTQFSIAPATGYLMFQVNESAENASEMTYSIVHADYQDHNRWSDACREGGIFVGTYTDNERKSATSQATSEYLSPLGTWQKTPDAKPRWVEAFNFAMATSNLEAMAYKTFGNANSPNGWYAGQGQWVASKFRDFGGGMALQMEGQGRGSLDYQFASDAPRGLESISYRARVAQFASFDTFSYYFGTPIEDMKDYLFTTRVIMANNIASDNFEGNGTVSLVGYFQPNIGGYEARAERIANDGVRLWLYKWYLAGNQIISKPLGYYSTTLNYASATNLRGSKDGTTTANQTSGNYGSMFIYCKTESDKTIVLAGLHNGNRTLSSLADNATHYCVRFEDTEDNRFKCGTFGFGSQNCPAQFIYPLSYDGGGSYTASKVATKFDKNAYPGFTYGSTAVDFTGSMVDLFYDSQLMQDNYKNWSINLGLFEKATIGNRKAVKAKVPTSKLEVRVAPAGTTEWETIASTNITSFGYTTYTNFVGSLDDAAVQLKMGGSFLDPRYDIVIDDVTMRQWRGESYDTQHNDNFASNPQLGYACPSNFVYTRGWVNVDGEEHTLDMQPMRAKPGVDVISLRSPLMDGNLNRGIGLGMFSFTYRNAHPKTVLKLQYAECDSMAELATLSGYDGNTNWTDAAVFDFSADSSLNPAGGTLSHYFGKHGFKGVMRLVVDEQVIADAHDSAKNPDGAKDYGMVTITSCLCRDEPEVDDSAWWGWNLRTTDDPALRILYDGDPTEAKMALVLNNSVDEDIDTDPNVAELYEQHVPFVQSPTFATNIVGEVTFKARKLAETDPTAYVTVLGAVTGKVTEDTEWEPLAVFAVESATFSDFSYKTAVGKDYASFRLAVAAVEGVAVNYREWLLRELGLGTVAPQRVVIDEIAVSEAIRGKVAFRNVYPFRSNLDNLKAISNITDKVEQPLCDEQWSVQAEVYASQLAEEIVFDEDTEVWLWWRTGVEPWGWSASDGNRAGVKPVKLARVESGELVFRGSLATGGVVDPEPQPGTVVQFMLDVVYKTAGGETVTNSLSAGDWIKPDWYRGVDFNRRYAASPTRDFTAYTILDKVPYGYAWINEVNIYDGPTPSDDISLTNQYIEVALPADAAIDDWKLQLITGGIGDQAFYTNTIAVYQNPDTTPNFKVPSKKSLGMDPASKYVFITVGGPDSVSEETKAAGTIDGEWSVDSNDFSGDQSQLTSYGYLNGGYPVGVQLVRSSGVIEHQIVVAGTNRYARLGEYYSGLYSATNFVSKLKAADAAAGSKWYFTEEDRGDDPGYSRGSTNQLTVIESGDDWAYLPKTPGRINAGQYISEEHPRPFGSTLVLYARLLGGHATQTIGTKVREKADIIAYIPKGLKDGTNIVYEVEDWYEIGSITETDEKGTKVYDAELPKRTGKVEFTVAKNASNDIELVASTRIRSDLSGDFGLTPDNRYTPAVMQWLAGGSTLLGGGRAFANQGGAIYPAKFVCISGEEIRDLTLTEMYWLDIDPTREGMVLKGGMVRPPTKVIWEKPSYTEVVGGQTVTNLRVGVYMMISNRLDAAYTPHAPYTIRGVVPGSSSATDSSGWTSATFKVTGYLSNGRDDLKPEGTKWLPLRYFVFDENSFGADFTATIEIDDPFQEPSPAYYQGWWQYVGSPVYFRWGLDSRNAPSSPEILRPESVFNY